MDQTLFQTLTVFWIALGVLVFPLTLLFTAPFGRHFSPRFGPSISNRLGWVIMESPAIWWFTIIFLTGASTQNYAAWIMWSLWMVHYVNRGLIFPLRTRTTGKQIPILIVVFALTFQLINGYLNGVALGPLGTKYTSDWLTHATTWIGLALFVLGWLVNIHSDDILLQLRKPNGVDYLIPRGGMFRWISCPNFLGEIVLWTGWAIMCWNLAALSFAVWTIANLLPRALAHHRWYRNNFPDYPPNRKAIVPGLL